MIWPSLQIGYEKKSLLPHWTRSGFKMLKNDSVSYSHHGLKVVGKIFKHEITGTTLAVLKKIKINNYTFSAKRSFMEGHIEKKDFFILILPSAADVSLNFVLVSP